MRDKTPYSELEKLKETIINSILLYGSVLSALTFIVSYYNFDFKEFRLSVLTDFIVVLTLTTISLFRKRINLKPKSLIIISALLVLMISDTMKMGINSDNKPLLIIIPFFALLVYDMRKTLLIFLFSILVFLTIGYLFVSGVLISNINYLYRAQQVSPWLTNILTLSAIALFVIIIFNQFNLKFSFLLDELKLKNLEITEKEQNYRDIFNSSSDAIFIHGVNGEIIDVNDAMLTMYGYKKEEIKSITMSDIRSGVEHDEIKDIFKHLEDSIKLNKTVFDWQAKTKLGKAFWVEVVLTKTTINNIPRIIAVVRDIEEKKRIALELENHKNHLEVLIKERTDAVASANAELVAKNELLTLQQNNLQNTLEKLESTKEQLIHSEKMASIGLLASGVAHEINNPLNFIKGGVSALEEYLKDAYNDNSEDLTDCLSAINEGINRSSAIIDSLNHFSRISESQKESCHLNSIIDNCLLILKNRLKYRIEIVKNYTNADPLVLGNDGKLHQAIINILSNAEQAIIEEGTIEIKTIVNKKDAVIYIIDTGIGINSHDLKKITDPFYTTKEPGQGTGLGLSITYNIIKDHNGTLSFQSIVNEGTTVIITLPLYNN